MGHVLFQDVETVGLNMNRKVTVRTSCGRKKLHNFSPHCNDSYRSTANFLNWVTEKYYPEIVSKMNAAMRLGKYNDGLWKEYTGKTAPELGKEWKKEVEAQVGNAPASAKAN
jgi:hypothetical protein